LENLAKPKIGIGKNLVELELETGIIAELERT
jgi:hypothetical protein